MLDEFSDVSTVGETGGHRGRNLAVVVVIAVFLLVIGMVASYLAFAGLTVASQVKHAPLLPPVTATDNGHTLTSGNSAAGPDAVRIRPAAKGAQNLLVVGSDSRDQIRNGRSDVIVLVHIAADHKSVQLIHFPRDLYVDVPGHGKDKINAAYAYGGVPLLVKTLNQLIDVPIDHVGLIGFTGFERMTDAVGGVTVYAEEASNERTVIHRGWNHLDGKQALAFVRERHQLSLGDISRGRRQEAFIKALLLKGLSKDVLANPVTLMRFLDAGTENLTVDQDFSTRDMISLAFSLRGLHSEDVTFVTAPWVGFGTTSTGASIVVMDEQRMRDLSDALRNDDVRAYERANPEG
ncbi:MAG TPA: LCP family protein [Segeticoccus sp.]|uniref:LCP family protein n=1 Tax=Segeticoccus sp. TaxID=2706531 RepID=UPI002D804AC7|nr:LCP family protein [Segeticoccus sp.]HET8601322.1 LCP family protein [Segeticoccus sp.]